MDFKKIKPNDVLGYLDDLVAKIPESISSILTKVMIGILVIACGYAAYYGYLQGTGSATQEGQELAKDTKSLFLEDIEREYNRKRKNIRMPSLDISDEIYKTPKQYESYGRTNETNDIVPPENSPLENDKSFRSHKRKGDTSPLAELNDTNPNPENTHPTDLEKSNSESNPKIKRPLRDNFDNPLSHSEDRNLDSVLDRVNTDSYYPKKILTKKESNKKRKPDLESPNVKEPEAKKDSGKLVIPEKSRKRENKRDILPIDGNE